MFRRNCFAAVLGCVRSAMGIPSPADRAKLQSIREAVAAYHRAEDSATEEQNFEEFFQARTKLIETIATLRQGSPEAEAEATVYEDPIPWSSVRVDQKVYIAIYDPHCESLRLMVNPASDQPIEV